MGLTHCNNDRNDYRSPEWNVPEEDYDLIIKIATLEEGIDDDPKQHDDRRPDNDDPGEEGPT